MDGATYQVLIFYLYTDIKNPESTAEWLKVLAERYSLKGRAIVAYEGVNATFEGLEENAKKFVQEFKEDPRFSKIRVKWSEGNGKSFPKLSVKVRDEIVGTHFPKKVDPRKKTGTYLPPEKLKQWIVEKKDFVIVDMRNDYEFASGHFRDSIPAGIHNSRELPEAALKLGELKDRTVLTVCTAGVRCEKMSAYLREEGFQDVYQLEDGIHGYMQKYPGEDFLGTLYTFDGRITMDFGGKREIVGRCRFCGDKTEQYVNCANDTCHLHFLVCSNCTKNEEIFCGKTFCSKE